jgi:hypothetical protein
MENRPKCKCKAIKFQDDNIEYDLEFLVFSDEFVHITPKSQSIKVIVNKLLFIKI